MSETTKPQTNRQVHLVFGILQNPLARLKMHLPSGERVVVGGKAG